VIIDFCLYFSYFLMTSIPKHLNFDIHLKVLFFLIAVLFASNQVSAQDQPVLGKFFITKVGNDVYLNWTINAGSICSGIEIERSTDSLAFANIGNIAGTCGSISEAVSYDFTDKAPVTNKRNYYRLIFGGTQVSKVISIEFIDVEKLGYQIRPHPLVDNAVIYFENNKKSAHQIDFYTNNGSLMHSLTVTSDKFEIQRSTFSAGLYHFIISNKDNYALIKGSLLVQ
jgi:hypothetical protein